MNLSDVLLSAGGAFAVAFFLLRLLLSGWIANHVLDQPNARSLHAVPVPRTGGLAVIAGCLAGWGLVSQPWPLALVFCTLFLVGISFLDDMHSLSAGWRMLAHIAAVAAFLAFIAAPHWGALLWLAALLALVWLINLYNFMDGSDGLAGGMALFGFGVYALAAWLATDGGLALAALSVTASATAFLVFNFHPAKIFMGDAGSIPLGFLAGAMGVLGWQHGDWPLWLPLLVFSPFIVDATVTLFKRLLRGEKVWHAHREHYYQRLVRMGWGHRKTACREYGLMVAAGASALWLNTQAWPVQAAGLACWVLIYCGLAWMVERRCR